KPANSMRINISTPIYHEGHVFAATAYGAGAGLARLSKKPTGEFAAEEVWFSKSMENHHGGVILHDGALFGANGGNGGGYLACLDFKTGEMLWNERDSDKRRVTKGSVAFADGRIYYRTDELFALWRRVGEMSSDPGIGLKLGAETRLTRSHPAAIAVICSRTFGDALLRLGRYKQLTCPEEIRVHRKAQETSVEFFYVEA